MLTVCLSYDSPQRVLHSLLCTRVLLHIRANSRARVEEITTTQVAMAFATRTDGRSNDLYSLRRPRPCAQNLSQGETGPTKWREWECEALKRLKAVGGPEDLEDKSIMIGPLKAVSFSILES